MSSFQRRLDLLDYVPRYPQKVTTRRLLNLLEQTGHSQLNIRTIQRDLESIEKLGLFGLEVDKRSKPFGWSVNASWKKLNISLMDSNTALAFATLEQLGESLLPESTLHDLSAYFEKAQTILKSEQTPLISQWKNSVAVITSTLPVHLPQVDKKSLTEIKAALFNQKQLRAKIKRYLTPNHKPVWIQYAHINPLGLLSKDGNPALVCSFGELHQKYYLLPLSFVKDVSIENNHVIIPPGFDFKQSTDANYGRKTNDHKILLKLKARKDCLFILLEGKLGDDQQIIDSDDDDHIILSATVNDSANLRTFLCGLGNSVEILAPAQLRTYFSGLARELFLKYEPAPGVGFSGSSNVFGYE